MIFKYNGESGFVSMIIVATLMHYLHIDSFVLSFFVFLMTLFHGSEIVYDIKKKT